VEPEELKKVPYITHIPRDGRSVFLQPYFDNKDSRWKMFVPQGPKLAWVFAEPVECSYFAETVADSERDMYMKVADIVTQHYSYPSAMHVLLRIITNIKFSAVVVDKYFLSLIRYRLTKDVLTANLVVTDLEYLFANARSVYDLTQRLFGDLWERKTRNKMKGTFREIVQKPAQELRSQYGLPDAMIEYYSSSKDFFFKIRAIRDAIFHYRPDGTINPPEYAFCNDDGFAVVKDEMRHGSLGLSFDIWPKEKTKPNGLVSILALIAYVNKMILQNCDKFSDALVRAITPPPAIAASHKLFTRSPFVHHLLKSDRYLEEQWTEGDLESRLTGWERPRSSCS
jgi:hypothetical protein